MKLAPLVRGTGTPVTFLHGFTQTRESWMPGLDSLRLSIEATLLVCHGPGASTEEHLMNP